MPRLSVFLSWEEVATYLVDGLRQDGLIGDERFGMPKLLRHRDGYEVVVAAEAESRRRAES